MAQETSISKKRGPKPSGRVPVLLALLPDTIEKIEAWAKARGLKRAEAIRQLIERGLR